MDRTGRRIIWSMAYLVLAAVIAAAALHVSAERASGCELPFGYVPGYIDLSAFGLIVPLAWIAWRRRSRR